MYIIHSLRIIRNIRFDMLLQTYLILIPILFHLTAGLLDAGDQSMYGNIFKSAFPYKDLKTAFQATSGLSKLGVNIMKQEKLCSFVKNEVNDKLDSLLALPHQ